MSKRVSLPSLQPSPQSSDSTVGKSDQDSSNGEQRSSVVKRSPSKSELRTRLVSMAPTHTETNPEGLKFEHNTKSQDRTRKRQQPIKLEPLVGRI